MKTIKGKLLTTLSVAAFVILFIGSVASAMIIGKGSLFLGRMTNLFDGVSFLIEANTGKAEEASAVSEEKIKSLIGEAMRDFAKSLIAE